MPRHCARCGLTIPRSAWSDDGRRLNLQHRRYCLKCSPFGSHNTRRLDRVARNKELGLICSRCKKPLSDAQLKGRVCWNCYYAARSNRRLDLVYRIVGEVCWNCGYTRGRAGRRVLDFHHVDPREKSFSLDARNLINLSWTRVIREVSKCVLLCANCHRESHAGLIADGAIQTLHKERWSHIVIPTAPDTSHPPPPAA
jgi:hypothetical protein